jgi:hypothetical protein
MIGQASKFEYCGPTDKDDLADNIGQVLLVIYSIFVFDVDTINFPRRR